MYLRDEKYTPGIKSGRAFNGAHRDSGTIVHLIQGDMTKSEVSWDKALCGTTPGIRGNGWNFQEENRIVTCDKCYHKYKNQPK